MDEHVKQTTPKQAKRPPDWECIDNAITEAMAIIGEKVKETERELSSLADKKARLQRSFTSLRRALLETRSLEIHWLFTTEEGKAEMEALAKRSSFADLVNAAKANGYKGPLLIHVDQG
jgi:hypothetical protein